MLAFTGSELLTNTIDYQTSGIKELEGLKSCIFQPDGKCHKLCMDFSTGQTFCTCQKGYFLRSDDLHTCQGTIQAPFQFFCTACLLLHIFADFNSTSGLFQTSTNVCMQMEDVIMSMGLCP